MQASESLHTHRITFLYCLKYPVNEIDLHSRQLFDTWAWLNLESAQLVGPELLIIMNALYDLGVATRLLPKVFRLSRDRGKKFYLG